MSLELEEKVTGVGALIVCPGWMDRGFLTIKELNSKRSTNKLAGMRSLPMETVEAGETHNLALKRMFFEETIPNPWLGGLLDTTLLCKAQLSPGVVLYSYLVEAPWQTTFSLGSDTQDVTDPHWMPRSRVLFPENNNHFAFRPGVFETIMSYNHRLRDPQNFEPQTFINLKNAVPDRVFDLMDQGVSQTEALSQLGLLPEPPLEPQLEIPHRLGQVYLPSSL